MTDTTPTLRKRGGGYVTPDGRFIVEPVKRGAGVTGWAGGRGWSNGHREWRVTDTTGQARFGDCGQPQLTVRRLYEVRDLIRAALMHEAV